jgi:hypothetical protein
MRIPYQSYGDPYPDDDGKRDAQSQHPEDLDGGMA